MKKRYRDGTLTRDILNTINQSPLTAKEIFSAIEYERDTDDLYSQMTSMRKRRLVSVIRGKPVRYRITERGSSYNPFARKQRRMNYINRLANERYQSLLDNNEDFQRAVAERTQDILKPEIVKPNVKNVIEKPVIKNIVQKEIIKNVIQKAPKERAGVGTDLNWGVPSRTDTSEVVQKMAQEVERQARIIQNQNTTILAQRERLAQKTPKQMIMVNPATTASGQVMVTPSLRPLTEEEVYLKKERMHEKKTMGTWRRSIAENYRGRYLDASFFQQIGYFVVKVKGASLFKGGSAEIISSSNPEWAREHINRILSPQAVFDGKYHIRRFNPKSITIFGRGMRKEATIST